MEDAPGRSAEETQTEAALVEAPEAGVPGDADSLGILTSRKFAVDLGILLSRDGPRPITFLRDSLDHRVLEAVLLGSVRLMGGVLGTIRQ